jgi:hypothetical protein
MSLAVCNSNLSPQSLLDRGNHIPRQDIFPRSLFILAVLYRHYPLTRRPRLQYVYYLVPTTEALMLSFTVHCTPATAEELSPLCRVILTIFVVGEAYAEASGQVDSGQCVGDSMFSAARGT